MDVEQKKAEIKGDIARGPENVVFARIDICDEVQLADLMKIQFTPYLRQTARAASSGTSGNATDTLHEVCVNLAKQRALLQGAAVTDVIHFNIADESTYNSSGTLSLPYFEDGSYSNKTSFGFIVLHDVNETGGSVTLSSTANANTTITDDDGNAIKYFTDFSKYFLTRSRANGELISIDDNTAPYTTPTIAEPFIPPNTINGEVFRGTAPDPTANSDVRYEFSTAANTSGGNAGGDLDIVESKWEGNTFVTITVSSVEGTFATNETISDFDLNTATIKTYANTTTVFLEGRDSKGTFTSEEVLSDLSTNATVSTIATVSNNEVNLTLTGSTFLTGSNTDISLGFPVSNTISLDTDAVKRSGSIVTIQTANAHGINPGERIALKGADTEFSEFNDTFIVEDITSNSLTFTTSNATSVTPTGDFSLVDNIVFGRTSNASMSIFKRTSNSSAQIVFQSDDLSTGFPIANTITGSSLGATGSIDSSLIGGTWYQTKTNEVKTFFSNSTVGTWDYDATNNPVGIPAAANAGVFWLQENEPVKINQIVAGTNAGAANETSPKMVLDIAIATNSDKTGGYDTSINTRLPGIYFAYPLKSYEDQVHDGVTTLGAYESFANVITAPEGLEINFDWLPLSENAAGNKTGADFAANGAVSNTAHIPDKVTTLSKANFEAHLGPYNGADSTTAFASGGPDDVFRSTNPDIRSSGVKVGVVYPSLNTNPFFPAVLANNNTATVYSAPNGANTANDIFAGSYTEIQTGAVDPEGNWRYRIWNDIKWTYGVNPHATGASKSGAYNAPRANTFLDVYDGFSATTSGEGFSGLAENTLDAIRDDDASGTATATRSAANFQLTGVSSISAASLGNSPVNTTLKLINAASGLYGSVVVTSTYSTFNEGAGNQISYTGGTVFTEVDCFHNFCHKITTDGAVALFNSGTIASGDYEEKLKILNTLLTNLTASTSAYANTAYVDPAVGSLGGSRIITDAAFETSIGNLKTKLSNFNTKQSAEIIAIKAATSTLTGTGSGTANHTATSVSISNCITSTYSPANFGGSDPSSRTSDLYTAYSEFKTQLATTRTDITNRITEISNRIGYVNSRDVADGGSGTKSLSGTATYQGFEGYAFNNGNGYANTVYSHANFLAGKKINLFGKVLKAIVAVQQMYDDVTKKRSEYYEYNQAS